MPFFKRVLLVVKDCEVGGFFPGGFGSDMVVYALWWRSDGVLASFARIPSGVFQIIEKQNAKGIFAVELGGVLQL